MKLSSVNNVKEFSLPIFIKKNDLQYINDGLNYKLIHIEKGTGIITINNISLAFNAPFVFCFNNTDVVKLEKSASLETTEIYFHPTLINDALTIEKINSNINDFTMSEYRDFCLLIPFKEREEKNHCHMEIGPITSRRLSDLTNLLQEEITHRNNNFWCCRSRSYFLEILFLLQYLFTLDNNNKKIELNHCPEEITDIILYLHTNYDKKITLELLAEKFNINRTTLSEKFNKYVGMPPIEYLIKLRINIATLMLKDSMLPISEIMYKVGFNDISHFGRSFRKYTGVSPSSFRN